MRIRGIVSGIFFGLLTFVVTFTGVFANVDKAAEDRLYHHAGNVAANIKIIKIDDRTMNQMGDFSTWNRSVYADLIETICVSEEVRPAVIGFDILFNSPKDEESDARFAEVCKNQGNVVTGFGYVFTKEVTEGVNGELHINTMAVAEKVEPFPALQEVTNQGFVNALTDDDDNIIRSSFIYFDEADGTRTKSFSSIIYEKYMQAKGLEVTYPTDQNGMTFRYSGKVGDYENVSLVDVLDGTVPPEAFDDCIVLVGAYAAGMLDSYFVPVETSGQMYGVEIHANVIQALMEGKTLTTLPIIVDALIIAVIAFLLAFVCN